MEASVSVEQPVASAIESSAAVALGEEEPQGCNVGCMLSALTFAAEVAEVMGLAGFDDADLRFQIEFIAAKLASNLGLGYDNGDAYLASLKRRNVIEALTVLGADRFSELIEYIATGPCDPDALSSAVLTLANAFQAEQPLLDRLEQLYRTGSCRGLRRLGLLLVAVPPKR